MAVNEQLVNRVRKAMSRRRGVTEQRMFGGVAFLINGKMCCGVVNDDLMLRLGKEGAADALDEDHTRPMDFTGRPMSTMIYVSSRGIEGDEVLQRWVKRAIAHVRTIKE